MEFNVLFVLAHSRAFVVQYSLVYRNFDDLLNAKMYNARAHNAK